VLLATSTRYQGRGKGGLPEAEDASGRIDCGDPQAACSDVDAKDEAIHEEFRAMTGQGARGYPPDRALFGVGCGR
jgi:hypothetical protein